MAGCCSSLRQIELPGGEPFLINHACAATRVVHLVGKKQVWAPLLSAAKPATTAYDDKPVPTPCDNGVDLTCNSSRRNDKYFTHPP
jgi:hypothetical protein